MKAFIEKISEKNLYIIFGVIGGVILILFLITMIVAYRNRQLKIMLKYSKPTQNSSSDENTTKGPVESKTKSKIQSSFGTKIKWPQLIQSRVSKVDLLKVLNVEELKKIATQTSVEITNKDSKVFIINKLKSVPKIDIINAVKGNEGKAFTNERKKRLLELLNKNTLLSLAKENEIEISTSAKKDIIVEKLKGLNYKIILEKLL